MKFILEHCFVPFFLGIFFLVFFGFGGIPSVRGDCALPCINNGTCINDTCICAEGNWCGSVCSIPCPLLFGNCPYDETPSNYSVIYKYDPSKSTESGCQIDLTFWIGFSLGEDSILQYHYCLAESSSSSCNEYYSTNAKVPIVVLPAESGKAYKFFLRGESCAGLGAEQVFDVPAFQPPVDVTVNAEKAWVSALSVGCDAANNTVHVILQWRGFKDVTGYEFCIETIDVPCEGSEAKWTFTQEINHDIFLSPSTNYIVHVRGRNCFAKSKTVKRTLRTPAIAINNNVCSLDWEGPIPQATVGNWDDWVQIAELRHERARSYNDLIKYLLGEEWFSKPLTVQEADLSSAFDSKLLSAMSPSSDSGNEFSESEIIELTSLPTPSHVSEEYKENLVQKWNRTWALYRAEGIVSGIETTQDIFDLSTLYYYYNQADLAYALDKAEGFSNNHESLRNLYGRLKDVAKNYREDALVNLDPSQISKPKKLRGICSKVRIRISQRGVLTRAAFRAELTLESGVPLSKIKVKIEVFDKDDNEIPEEIFVIGDPELNGITGVDGEGTLVADLEGKASWLMVPLPNAAPREPTVYKVGGILEYALNSTAIVQFELQPDEILVMPDPRLNVKYFFSRQVQSDDPFTPEIEPPVPFDLGVMIHNSGYGKALNFELFTGQPEIIENEKGLLVDFKIIGCRLMNESFEPSFSINFGSIEPQGTKVATWVMVSSLEGTFSNFSANYKYKTPLGDPRLSLLDSLDIFELTRTVYADRPQDDPYPDFLVNSNPSESDDMPDELHTSEYRVLPVFAAKVLDPGTPTEIDTNVFSYNFEISGLSSRTEAFMYLRIPQPQSVSGRGNNLILVQNADTGEVMKNAWRTYRILRLLSGDDEIEDFVHLFTRIEGDSYRFEVRVGTIPQVRNVKMERSSKTSVLLSWDPMPEVVSYTVQMNNGSDWITIQKDVISNRFQLSPLEPQRTYEIRILPNGESGSPPEDAAIVYTIETSGCDLDESNNFGLCTSDSDFNPTTCECDCSLTCENGNLDAENCSCTCQPGFIGNKCDIPVEEVNDGDWWQNNVTDETVQTTGGGFPEPKDEDDPEDKKGMSAGAIAGISIAIIAAIAAAIVATVIIIKKKPGRLSSKIGTEKFNPLYRKSYADMELETVSS